MIKLGVITPDVRPNFSVSEDWMFGLILLVLGLLAFVRWNYSKNFSELFSSLINVNKMREVIREEIVLTSRASQILLVISVLSLSLFSYLGFKVYDQSFLDLNLSGFSLFLVISVCIGFIYAFKAFFNLMIRYLYGGDFTLTEYEFNINLFLRISGLALIPVSLVIIYSSFSVKRELIVFGISVWVISILCRYLRGFVNAINHRISIFYIILYLCAFEILPVAVILKVLF